MPSNSPGTNVPRQSGPSLSARGSMASEVKRSPNVTSIPSGVPLILARVVTRKRRIILVGHLLTGRWVKATRAPPFPPVQFTSHQSGGER
jgi:hypothetical protein